MTDQPPKFRFIGQPVPRNEDARLLTGKGQFSDDFSFPGQTYAAMVRSPHPHARILRIDKIAAHRHAGRSRRLHRRRLRRRRARPDPARPAAEDQIRHETARAPDGSEVFIGPHVLLPADKARHVGEAVAMVVAETAAAGARRRRGGRRRLRGAALRHPFRRRHEAGRSGGVGRSAATISSSTRIRRCRGDRHASFAAADHVVAMDFHIDRVTGAPMEPRAAVAHYDAATGRYTIYAGSGGAVRQKRELAPVLGIAPERSARALFRCRRQFRHAQSGLCRVRLSCCGPRANSAGRSNTPPRVRNAFISDYQGRDLVAKLELALDERRQISRACARPISAMPAHAASRCRRSAKAPG